MTSARRRALLILALTAPLFAWGVGRTRLVAFDARWPAASGSEITTDERRPLDQALAQIQAADEDLRARVEALAASLVPRIADALGRPGSADALQAALAASPPVASPELLEIRDRGQLLGWSGHASVGWSVPPGPPAERAGVSLLDGVPPALVARLGVKVGKANIELALFAPLRHVLASNDAISLRAADSGDTDPLELGPAPGLLSAEIRASSGEQWRVSAPRASRVVARRHLEHEARVVTLLAIAGIALLFLALLGHLLTRSAAPVWRRLLLWTAAVAALAIGYHVFETRTGWLSMLPDAFDGEPFYADADHALGRFTQSPLALLLSSLALLGWLLVCRRIIGDEVPEIPGPRVFRGACALGAVALGLGLLALFALEIRSVVRFSYEVDLFPDDRVVPAGAALVLELALLLGALLVLLGTDVLTAAALGALRLGALGRPVLLGLALLLGLPWLPAIGGWSTELTCYLIGLTAFTAALRRGLREYGHLARTLVVLLGAGALLFPALSRQLRSEQLESARAKASSGLDRDEAATLLSVRLQSVLDEMGHVLTGSPPGWPAREASAFKLWRGHRESLGPRALIRLIDADGVIESRFEIGMPPPDWYFGALDDLQYQPDQDTPTRLRLRRGRFELSILAQLLTVEHEGGNWRILLALPLVDDPLLPADADPGMRLPGPLPGDGTRQRELVMHREPKGRIRCPLPVGALDLPSPKPGELQQVRRQVAGGQAELFVRGEEDGSLHVVGVRLPDNATLFVDYVRLLLILVAGAAVWLPLVLLRRIRRRVALGLAIERRLLAAFGVLSILPLAWLAVFSARRGASAIEQTVRARLAGDLVQLRALVVDRLDAAGGDLDVALHGADGALSAARRQGMTLLVYRKGELVAGNRPGMVRSGVLPVRPPAIVQRDLVARRADRRFSTLRRIDDAPLPIAFGALRDPATGSPMAILATVSRAGPDALLREQARTTRVAVAVYGLTLLAVLLLGMVIARKISRPVEALLEGTRQIAAGNLEHQISYPASDEFGELVDSFNAMTSQVRLLQEQRVDAGRSEVMSTMARQIAHEIKNPLTPMKLAAQHLRDAHARKHERFDDILEKTTRTVIEQVDALHRIASAFSTYGHFPDRELRPVDIESLLDEVAQMYDGYEGRIAVIRRFTGGLEPVAADRDELRRVFINLATNAVQAIDGDGRLVLITGRSLLEPIDSRGGRAGEPRPCVEVKFIDTGAGIAEANLDRIFVPNFSTKTSGTGLGLPICRKAVHALGGSMSIASRVGEGTIVSVSLPTVEG